MKIFTKNIYSFEEDVWKNNIKKRKNYLDFILQDVWIIGKTKEEVFVLFGEEGNYFQSDKWTYFINKSIWYGKRYLAVYFEENEVDRVILEKSK